MNFILGDSGIVGRAKDTRNTYDIAKANEDETMSGIMKNIDNAYADNGNVKDIENIPDIDKKIDLPEKKSDDELIRLGYIPIYTAEQYKKIATETKKYQILDLQGNDKGSYNMNKDAKYAFMNDIDFASAGTMTGIIEFRGEIEGNGCTLKNIDINRESYTQNVINSKYKDNRNADAGLVCAAENAKIQNLAIEDSSFTSSDDSAGAFVGACNNTKINNCYAINCTTNGYYNVGGIAGVIFDKIGSKLTNCKTINPKGTSSKLAGIVGFSFENIEMDNCQTIYDEYTEQPCYGLIFKICTRNADSNVKITNCSAQNLYEKADGGYNHYGGIINGVYLNDCDGRTVNINIENCTSKNIKGNNSSAIIGMISNYLGYDQKENDNNKFNVKIDKCRAQSIEPEEEERNDKYAALGGITNVIELSNIDKDSKISITNCSVKDINGKRYAGIAGYIYGDFGTSNDENIIIENCQAQNIINASSGIVKIIDGCSNIKINQCTSKDITGKSYGNFGGIAGLINRNSEKRNEKNLTINNCVVNNIKIIKDDEYDYSPCGGIVGNIQSRCDEQYKSIKFNLVASNCISKNIEFDYSTRGNPTTGGIIALYSGDGDAYISDCFSENLNFKSKEAMNSGGIIRND